jgi:hypothetical protein
VRARLPGERQLLEPGRAHRAGAQDRAPHARDQRDGARGHRRRDGSPRASPTSTRAPTGNGPASTARCGPASWCSRPARSRRRGCSSTRARRSFPDGLANSSGTVGRYITDTTGTDVAGFVPEAARPRAAQRGRRGRDARLHAVVARQREAPTSARLPHRGVGRARAAGYGFLGGIQRLPNPGARRPRGKAPPRAAATAPSSRTTTAASTARRSASRGAAR